jgi:pyruvate formate-lyase activating enzyme-like uncharacterized protein
MEKTPFDSFTCNGFAQGCNYCVQGKKLVLFVSGKCSRQCKYCSLSNKRKNIDKIWANERECHGVRDVLEEAEESKACGAGITGGDPLLCLPRTIRLIKALKKKFKPFHVHIYLPTELVTEPRLRKLNQAGVDEIRFHPKFLEKDVNKEVKKISLASKFWKKQDIGIELPMFPSKVKETLDIIKAASSFIGFVNLNELEISDTNFDFIKSKYNLNEDSYTIKGSKKAGMAVLKTCEKLNLGLRVHLCTARTKNLFQYKNRLKLREVLPFGYKTKEGTVRYFIVDLNKMRNKDISKITSKLKGDCFLDKKKNRIILSEKIVEKAFVQGYKVERVEELPTWDAIELERESV